jgi:hypothetical protein
MKTIAIKKRDKKTAGKELKRKRTPVLPVPSEVIENAPWSSAVSLLKFATGWAGDDLDDLLAEVQQFRGKARF